MSTGKINLNVGAEMVTGPRGLSILKVEKKETLPNGDNVYNIFLENETIIGFFTSAKGDQGEIGLKGDNGTPGIGIKKITTVKEGITNKINILLDNGVSETINVLDGDQGESIQYQWKGTQLGIKLESEENYTFVDLKGESGEAGKNLEFIWRGTELGVRVQEQTEYQYVDLKGSNGANGKNLEFNWRGKELGVKVEGQSEYQYVDLEAEGPSLPIGTIVKYPVGNMTDHKFKKLDGSVLESKKYPGLVGLLSNPRVNQQNTPRNMLSSNTDDQLKISLIKESNFSYRAYRTFGEGADGFDFAFYDNYVGIKLDARNADYILEYDPNKYQVGVPIIANILVQTKTNNFGYSLGIFGGENGLENIPSINQSQRMIEPGSHGFMFDIMIDVNETHLLKRTPLTFRIFKTGEDISNNDSPGFNVSDVEIRKILISSTLNYNKEFSEKNLALPKEIMTYDEKLNKFGYEFNEYMFVGEPVIKKDNNKIYSYDVNNNYIGTIPFSMASENNIPRTINGITLSEPYQIKPGYTNKYLKNSDSWELIRTYDNKEGYYYNNKGELKYLIQPSEFHTWNQEINSWELNEKAKDKYLYELKKKMLMLEIQKDKAIELKLNIDDLENEIKLINDRMVGLNAISNKQ